MKVAIVGAGFYGCSIAVSLAEDYPDFKINLFEKNIDIFRGAALNNQHRIHKGYHYPRSTETIDQILMAYKSFKDKYGHLIKKVKNNYYLIDNNSHISFEEYIKVYKNYDLNFKEIDKKELKQHVDVSKIEGVIQTDEEVIYLWHFREHFMKEINKKENIKLHLNTEFDDFDKYDLVINCTYENPNLGLNKNTFDIKYESCIIPVVNNFFKDNICITIMDGPFVSAYQDGIGNLTLSSVVYTPYFKTESYEELKEKLKNDKPMLLKNEILKLLNHCQEYFIGMDNLEIFKVYLSPKIKLKNDINSLRIADIKKEGNVISILGGKISSIVHIYELVKKEIENVN